MGLRSLKQNQVSDLVNLKKILPEINNTMMLRSKLETDSMENIVARDVYVFTHNVLFKVCNTICQIF